MKETYNPDIHHRRSIRLREYDYRGAGAYFVTICAFQRECLFGEVVGGEMRSNATGMVVEACWRVISTHFHNVLLDEFVVMPNHFHGILHVVGEKQGSSASPLRDGTLSGSLGAIIQNFKSVSTRKINKLRNNPGCPVWQRNYYEHVVRNEADLTSIREYIANNPLKWEFDENNPANAGK